MVLVSIVYRGPRRMLMQMQQLGHGLVRHVPTQIGDLLGEPVRLAGVLYQRIQPLHFHPPTAPDDPGEPHRS